MIKKDSGQTAASCRVAHSRGGGGGGGVAVGNPYRRCVIHVGQMTAHCWIAGWVVLSTVGDAFVIFSANSSLLCQRN